MEGLQPGMEGLHAEKETLHLGVETSTGGIGILNEFQIDTTTISSPAILKSP
jgi:hypothetical protein